MGEKWGRWKNTNFKKQTKSFNVILSASLLNKFFYWDSDLKISTIRIIPLPPTQRGQVYLVHGLHGHVAKIRFNMIIISIFWYKLAKETIRSPFLYTIFALIMKVCVKGTVSWNMVQGGYCYINQSMALFKGWGRWRPSKFFLTFLKGNFAIYKNSSAFANVIKNYPFYNR